MSMMNCSAAIQAVLDQAAGRMNSLIVIRVDAASGAPPAVLSRRLSLPLSGDAQLAFAMGCAQAGLRPVLDLTALRDAPERLEAAFAALPRASRRPMVIRIAARRCPALPGVHVIAPANARECAGAMRFALQSELISLIVENPLSAYEACEVPDDPDELFAGAPLPDERTPDEEKEADASPAPEGDMMDSAEEAPEAEAPVPAEETPAADKPVQTEGTPGAGETAWAFRVRPYDPAELMRTASLLGMDACELAALCCEKAAESARVALETDAEPGEVCCLPPDGENACLWVGRDRLALCWNAPAMTNEDARALIRETAARLELPARLILED